MNSKILPCKQVWKEHPEAMKSQLSLGPWSFPSIFTTARASPHTSLLRLCCLHGKTNIKSYFRNYTSEDTTIAVLPYLGWTREDWEGILSMLTNILKAGVKRMGPDSFQWCSVTGQEETGIYLNTGSTIWIWGKTSLLWGWQSHGTDCPDRLWIFKTHPGGDPVQPVLGEPALAGELD